MVTKGIHAHICNIDEKVKARLGELDSVRMAIRRIQPGIEGYEGFVAKVVSILQENVPKFTWVGYYWVRPDKLVLKASSGFKENEEIEIKIRRGVAGRAAANGRIITGNLSGIFKSEAATPVERFGNVVGVILVKSDIPNAFGPQEIEFLQRIADEIACRWLGPY